MHHYETSSGVVASGAPTYGMTNIHAPAASDLLDLRDLVIIQQFDVSTYKNGRRWFTKSQQEFNVPYLITAIPHNLNMSKLKISHNSSKHYTTVIFDLGDVLFTNFTWSASTPKLHLPGKTLINILRSFHWFEYEKRKSNRRRSLFYCRARV